MDWNSITLFVLGAFGILSLLVTMLTSLARQLPELANALRAAWSSFRRPRRASRVERQRPLEEAAGQELSRQPGADGEEHEATQTHGAGDCRSGLVVSADAEPLPDVLGEGVSSVIGDNGESFDRTERPEPANPELRPDIHAGREGLDPPPVTAFGDRRSTS